jgi:hypothetical protein
VRIRKIFPIRQRYRNQQIHITAARQRRVRFAAIANEQWSIDSEEANSVIA